jgi:hypothetical protein
MTATVGQLYRYDVDAADPDVGDSVTYTLSTAPMGMIIDAGTRLIQWTPKLAQIGAQHITIEVRDRFSALAS